MMFLCGQKMLSGALDWFFGNNEYLLCHLKPTHVLLALRELRE